ncbi:MAG: type II toxin-antitoxin system RelE/ParE family toxin [Thaumarchaeota archaeon]|nr:type II toxin-antitoxin system RelE/ParE family toxin [Candidatus Geocrenenecus arthurdayi]
MFEVLAKRRVLKALKKLDEGRRRQFREVFLLLKRNPITFRELDVVKLRGYENMYRIRMGDYRIVYEVLWAERR